MEEQRCAVAARDAAGLGAGQGPAPIRVHRIPGADDGGKVLALRKDGQPADIAREGDAVEVFLERTPFYAESGRPGRRHRHDHDVERPVRVDDTQKPAEGAIAHLGRS